MVDDAHAAPQYCKLPAIRYGLPSPSLLQRNQRAALCIAICHPQSMDLVAPNYTVPTATTTYMCINYEMPSDTKYHIVYYEAVIAQPALVHHFVVYSCASKPSTPTGQVYDCLGSMRPECEHFYIAWGVRAYVPCTAYAYERGPGKRACVCR